MTGEVQFVIINGRRYRVPKPMIRLGEEQDKLDDVSLKLHEALHNVASLLSRIEGWDRSQRYSHAIPQILYEMLGRIDQGAAIAAAEAFLESLGYTVNVEDSDE